MKNIMRSLLLILSAAAISSVSWADTPPSLHETDSHSVEAKGVINLYRVQVQDMEFGRGDEKVDAEIFVTLNSTPDTVFTLRLHDDSPAINKVIAATLRDAYLNKVPVTIYYQIGLFKKHVKILMVQMN